MPVLLVLGLVAAVYLHDLSLRRKFDARLESIRARGEPVTFADVLALREKMPPEENSALILLDAFEKVHELELEGKPYVWDLWRRGGKLGARHSQQMREMIGAYLEDRAEALSLIHEAAQLSGGVYPLEPTGNPYAMLLPHLHPLQQAARLGALEALYHAHAGEGREAARSVVACRRLAASVGDCILIEALVRMAVDGITLDALERSLGLCEMQEEDLCALRDELRREEEGVSLEFAFLAERAGAYWVFKQTANPYKELRSLVGATDSPESLRSFVYGMFPGQRARDALFFYDTMDRALAICHLPLGKKLKEGRRLDEELVQQLSDHRHEHLISAVLMPACARVFELEVRTKTIMRVARTALAVEQWRQAHGGWPDSLEQLVPELLDAVPEDPFSEGPLRYRKTDIGVVVYSVGPDGQDNKGLPEDEFFRPARAPEGSGPEEGRDLPFRLLNVELRGAETLTFRDEIMGSNLDLEALEACGFGSDRLRELGLTEEDIEKLRPIEGPFGLLGPMGPLGPGPPPGFPPGPGPQQ